MKFIAAIFRIFFAMIAFVFLALFAIFALIVGGLFLLFGGRRPQFGQGFKIYTVRRGPQGPFPEERPPMRDVTPKPAPELQN